MMFAACDVCTRDRLKYTVLQKKTRDYIFYNNLNNKCPITVIFGMLSSQTRRHRKMVSQNSSTALEVKFSHILQWSSTNKLKLNTLKTNEIVFYRPRLPNQHVILEPFLLCFPAFPVWKHAINGCFLQTIL